MIGSLTVVLVLIVLAVLVIAVVGLAVLVALAGSMTDWRALRRRLTRGRARLPLKLSADTAPARLRAELSGGIPRVRRRLRLGGLPSGRRGSGGEGADARRLRPHGHRPVRRRIGI